jgi:hypothetical protein
MPGVNTAGQVFQPRVSTPTTPAAPLFPNPLRSSSEPGDWKVARTGRLESLPYWAVRIPPDGGPSELPRQLAIKTP